MYKIQVEYLDCINKYESSQCIESFTFETKREALEKYRILLAFYLVGYGVIWDNIGEKEHKKELLKKSLDELKAIEFEAILIKS